MAVLATYLAGLCDYSDKLSPGERGVVLLLAPDMKEAKVLLDYAEGTLESNSSHEATAGLPNGRHVDAHFFISAASVPDPHLFCNSTGFIPLRFIVAPLLPRLCRPVDGEICAKNF